MPGVHADTSSEVASRNVARVVWGLLLIWIGAALLLRWSWGVGLVGAGAILLGAQAYRRASQLTVDGFGLAAGIVLVVCGVWNLLDVAIALVPFLCIAAGVVLVVSTWTAHRHAHVASGGTDVHAPSHHAVGRRPQ